MSLAPIPGPIAVIDVETTGLFPFRHDRVVELAAVVIQGDGRIEREFVSLVNPARADKGELVVLAWKGGVKEKLKIERKPGTLNYLATWQGLRGEDLDIALEDERLIVCSKTGQTVAFSAKLPVEEQ